MASRSARAPSSTSVHQTIFDGFDGPGSRREIPPRCDPRFARGQPNHQLPLPGRKPVKTSHTTGTDTRTASGDGRAPAPTFGVRHLDHPPPWPCSCRTSEILVPLGAADRWQPVMATSRWPDRFPRPKCLGRRGEHKIQVPAPSPRPDATTRWLEPPADDLLPGRGSLFTSPAPLVRCLTEACTILAPEAERTPLRRAVSAVRSVLRSPQRT